MFNRRELFIGLAVAIADWPWKASKYQNEGSGLEDFVFYDNHEILALDVVRQLRCRAGVIKVFSPEGKLDFAIRRTDDLAQIWDGATGIELKVVGLENRIRKFGFPIMMMATKS